MPQVGYGGADVAGGEEMSASAEVYELDRIIADHWRMYRILCGVAQSWRVDGFLERANFDGRYATLYMQAAQRAEIRRKALLKGRRRAP